MFVDPGTNGHAPTGLAIVVFLSTIVGTFVAGALSTTAGGGIVHSLAVGFVPSVVIVLTGLGRDLLDSGSIVPELRAILLTFAVLGIVGIGLALAGFVAVSVLNWLGSVIARSNPPWTNR